MMLVAFVLGLLFGGAFCFLYTSIQLGKFRLRVGYDGAPDCPVCAGCCRPCCARPFDGGRDRRDRPDGRDDG